MHRTLVLCPHLCSCIQSLSYSFLLCLCSLPPSSPCMKPPTCHIKNSVMLFSVSPLRGSSCFVAPPPPSSLLLRYRTRTLPTSTPPSSSTLSSPSTGSLLRTGKMEPGEHCVELCVLGDGAESKRITVCTWSNISSHVQSMRVHVHLIQHWPSWSYESGWVCYYAVLITSCFKVYYNSYKLLRLFPCTV